ncbi:hypothetical protein KSP39_PZI023247 [Platanthera zijinensis]|uniref:Uncharacterized protein n=1 Tax=Platanthera zijinensis TaxID=2320716 RepID=A0AAP0FV29_9ASPA
MASLGQWCCVCNDCWLMTSEGSIRNIPMWFLLSGLWPLLLAPPLVVLRATFEGDHLIASSISSISSIQPSGSIAVFSQVNAHGASVHGTPSAMVVDGNPQQL